MKNEVCPVCGEGHLHSKAELTEVEYKSTKKGIETRFSSCDACGSELASNTDSKFNKRSVMSFKKSVDGLLTGDELKKNSH